MLTESAKIRLKPHNRRKKQLTKDKNSYMTVYYKKCIGAWNHVVHTWILKALLESRTVSKEMYTDHYNKLSGSNKNNCTDLCINKAKLQMLLKFPTTTKNNKSNLNIKYKFSRFFWILQQNEPAARFSPPIWFVRCSCFTSVSTFE